MASTLSLRLELRLICALFVRFFSVVAWCVHRFGVYFDVEARDVPITIQTIETGCSSGADGQTLKVQLWATKDGSFVGKEEDQSAWECMGEEDMVLSTVNYDKGAYDASEVQPLIPSYFMIPSCYCFAISPCLRGPRAQRLAPLTITINTRKKCYTQRYDALRSDALASLAAPLVRFLSAWVYAC